MPDCPECVVLQAKLRRLREALADIMDPLPALLANAEQAAIGPAEWKLIAQRANDAETLKNIARRALIE